MIIAIKIIPKIYYTFTIISFSFLGFQQSSMYVSIYLPIYA